MSRRSSPRTSPTRGASRPTPRSPASTHGVSSNVYKKSAANEAASHLDRGQLDMVQNLSRPQLEQLISKASVKLEARLQEEKASPKQAEEEDQYNDGREKSAHVHAKYCFVSEQFVNYMRSQELPKMLKELEVRKAEQIVRRKHELAMMNAATAMEEARVKQDRHTFLVEQKKHDEHFDRLQEPFSINFLTDDVKCRQQESETLIEQLPAISAKLWGNPTQLDLDADEWIKKVCLPHLQFVVGMTPDQQKKSIDELMYALRDTTRPSPDTPCFLPQHIGVAQFELSVEEAELAPGMSEKAFTGVAMSGRLHGVWWLSCPRLATIVTPGEILTVKSVDSRFGGKVVLSNDASFEQTIEGLDKFRRLKLHAEHIRFKCFPVNQPAMDELDDHLSRLNIDSYERLVASLSKEAEMTAVEAGEDVAQAKFRRERLERQCELLLEGPMKVCAFDDLPEEVAANFERLKGAVKALRTAEIHKADAELAAMRMNKVRGVRGGGSPSSGLSPRSRR